jgi:hypothetical protein
MTMRRHERVRLQNVRICVGARRHHFSETIGIPFLCECDDELCHEFVVVTLRAFERVLRDRLVLVAHQHELEAGVWADTEAEYALYRVPDGCPAAGSR